MSNTKQITKGGIIMFMKYMTKEDINGLNDVWDSNPENAQALINYSLEVADAAVKGYKKQVRRANIYGTIIGLGITLGCLWVANKIADSKLQEEEETEE